MTYGYEIWLSYTESRARSLRDWPAAVQKAVAVDPYDGEAYQKGVELAERAIRLTPNYPAWYLYGLHRVYYFAGEFEKALAAARRAEGLSGPLLAAIYGQLGRKIHSGEGHWA